MAHPSYKLLTLRSIPQMSETAKDYSVFQWPGLLKHLRQMLIASAPMEEGKCHLRLGLQMQIGLNKHACTFICVPETFYIFQGINWSVKASATQRDFNHSVSNLLVLRGCDKNSDVGSLTSSFTDSYLYPAWMPPGDYLTLWHHARGFHGYQKSAVLLSNSQSVVRPLDTTVDKAWNMFASRAYVHHYAKHGLTEEDFMDSFATLEQVIHNYKTL